MLPRLLATLLAIAFALGAAPLHADCELLYAPKAIRARVLAFHHASEHRRLVMQETPRAPSAPSHAGTAPMRPTSQHATRQTPAALRPTR